MPQTFEEIMNNKLGQHFSLGYAEQIKNSFPGQYPYTIQMRSAVAFIKGTDRMLLDAIIQKAKENGTTDLYVLNEDFILGAIREKMERESKGADLVPVVRCRECKHFNLETHECENELLSTDHEGGASYSLNFYDDDFCSYGEKSTDNSTEK